MLSKERLCELTAILARSNSAAKTAAASIMGNRKYPDFRRFLRGEKIVSIPLQQQRLIRSLPDATKDIIARTEEVRDEISLAFMPLALSICKRFESKDDVTGEAWILLAKAIYGYDNVAFTFEAYVRRVILKEIQRYSIQNAPNRLTSQSGEYEELANIVNSVTQSLTHQFQRQPTFEEIFDAVAEVFPTNNLFVKLRGVIATINDVADEVCSLDMLFGKEDKSLAQINDEVEVILSKMSCDERTMIQKHIRGESYKTIAAQYGVAPPTVQNRMNTIYKRIRQQNLQVA